MLIDVSNEEVFAKIHCAGCGTWMRVRQIFANFEIQGILGEGGQGMVYRATDLKLNRSVAMKVIRREFSRDESFKKRFESEAQITASLNHPNIVKVYSHGEDQGLMYLAMEMVAGGSLDSMMTDGAKVAEDRVLEVGAQIARGLKAGLEKGLIHRDIKPGNILFSEDQTAKIVDFGLAILVEKQHEETGEMWATPYYVAPEKLDGTPEDFRSDMYSLAATLFHAIAGRPPFITESNSMAELKKIKTRPVHLLSFAPGVCNATAFVIDKALSANPKERFESYDSFIENLEFARAELRKGGSVAPRRVVVPMAQSGGSWITFAAVAAIVAGGLYYWLNRTPTAPVPVAKIENGAPKASPEVRYEKARREIMGARRESVAAEFRALFADDTLGEPMHSWSAVHEALAEFLMGRPVIAQEALKKLGAQVSSNAIGMDDELAKFFTLLAKHGSSPESTPISEAGVYKKETTEAVALLLVGLKNWEIGAHEESVKWFKEYQSAAPSGPATWAGEYRKLVGNYLEDFANFQSVAGDIRNFAIAPEKAAAAMKILPVVKGKMKSPSLVAILSDLERENGEKIEAAVASAAESMKKQRAEQERAEETALTDVKMKLKDLCENYRFSDALAMINAANVTIEQNVAERDLLAQRISWLVNFKQTLIRDVSGTGYSAALIKKNGQQIAGGVARATDTQIEVKVAFGSVPMPWADLAPASVMAMAASFIKPNLPIDNIAERQWQLGVFGLFTGKVNEGVQFMDQAAAVRDEYRIHRAMFFESTNQDPAPAPATPPANASPTPGAEAEQPMADGTEMSKAPLNPSGIGGAMNAEPNLRRPKPPGTP
jgi:eukaryotic-like serine/threonine-protein kinase